MATVKGLWSALWRTIRPNRTPVRTSAISVAGTRRTPDMATLRYELAKAKRHILQAHISLRNLTKELEGR